MKKIIIINGPNLNLLGAREVELYGTKTLKEIEKECNEIFKNDKLSLNFFQSNSESEIIDKIHICNNYSREEFRKNSFISPVVNGIIAGFGTQVYQVAINSIKYL